MVELSLRQSRVDELRTATVTVAVVSADLRNAHARKCVDQLKRHTLNFDLWILDNNNSTAFNHSREINKVLKSANTDFVVLMDDDVFVEPGWLPNLLRAMDEKTGLVAPMHRDAGGAFSFSGVYLMGMTSAPTPTCSTCPTLRGRHRVSAAHSC